MKKFWALLSDGTIMPVLAKDIERAPRKIGGIDVVGLGNGYGVIRSLKEVLYSKEVYVVEGEV
jgi:hypothetical protein